MEFTLRKLTERYVGSQTGAFNQLCLSKPCKKPKWREFEDSDDEKEYRQKLIKYRQWKHSLLSSKNVIFEAVNSPSKNFPFKQDFFVENSNHPKLLKKQSSMF